MDKRSILFIICITVAYFGVNQWFGGQQNESLKQHQTAKKAQTEKPLALMRMGGSSEDVGPEDFYVLENDYQQLVFSTRGGSLAEINLPFESKDKPGSIVKEIDIDRLIAKDSPRNARFPLMPYQVYGENGLEEKSEGALGGYYPLLRRTQLNSDGSVKHRIKPEFYALNIVGEDEEVSNLIYRFSRF